MYNMKNRKPAKLDIERIRGAKEIMQSRGFEFICDILKDKQKEEFMIFRKNHKYYLLHFSLKVHYKRVFFGELVDMDLERGTFKVLQESKLYFTSLYNMDRNF